MDYIENPVFLQYFVSCTKTTEIQWNIKKKYSTRNIYLKNNIIFYNKSMSKIKEEKEKPSLFSRIKSFVRHKTIWRLVAIGSAVAATILSGGATIPLVMLGFTFAGSLLGVVGKLRQTRSLEKYSLQKSIAKAILEKKRKVDALDQKHGKILDKLPKKQEISEIHNISTNQPSKTRSLLRTIRDVGLENSLSIVTLASAANPIGAAVYAGSVALGIYNIKSEFKERVKTDFETDKAKKDINEISKEASIKPYRNTADLHDQFKEEMIDYETKKHLCEVIGSNHDIDSKSLTTLYGNIREEVEERIDFPDVPKSVSFMKKFRDVANPFKVETTKDYGDIDIDRVSRYKDPKLPTNHLQRKPGHPTKTPGLKKGKMPRSII